MALYDILRPLLFSLEAESAHRLTLYGLGVAQRSGFAHRFATVPADLPVRAFGIEFPNPVGLAAGLDKNAVLTLQVRRGESMAFVTISGLTDKG